MVQLDYKDLKVKTRRIQGVQASIDRVAAGRRCVLLFFFRILLSRRCTLLADEVLYCDFINPVTVLVQHITGKPTRYLSIGLLQTASDLQFYVKSLKALLSLN
jgi:hypothetical protein